MSPKTQGWFVISGVLVGMVVFLILPLGFVQGLPRARLGVVATLDAPPGEAVQLAVSLPRGYGLTPLERRQGWDELNKSGEAEVTLGNEPVTVTLPRVSYCVTYPVWSDPPPPPAHFVLRFSNAPDETYHVFRLRDGGVYLVRDSNGLETPVAQATWKLTIGAFESPDPAGTPERRWLLSIRAERQHAEPGDGQAQAFVLTAGDLSVPEIAASQTEDKVTLS